MSITSIKKWNIFLSISFLLLVVGTKSAAASQYRGIAEIPPLIHVFLLINLFLTSLALVMMLEVKKVSHSNVWNNTNISNFFCFFVWLK